MAFSLRGVLSLFSGQWHQAFCCEFQELSRAVLIWFFHCPCRARLAQNLGHFRYSF